jgi:hypothetical protein
MIFLALSSALCPVAWVEHGGKKQPQRLRIKGGPAGEKAAGYDIVRMRKISYRCRITFVARVTPCAVWGEKHVEIVILQVAIKRGDFPSLKEALYGRSNTKSC